MVLNWLVEELFSVGRDLFSENIYMHIMFSEIIPINIYLQIRIETLCESVK